MNVKINGSTLLAVQEVVKAALEHGVKGLFGEDFEPEDLADLEDSFWKAQRFANLNIPHGLVTWRLVDQGEALKYRRKRGAPGWGQLDTTYDTLGTSDEDHHV